MATVEFMIPIYRSAPFLTETLASLLRQNHPDTKIQIRAVGFPQIRTEIDIPSSVQIHEVSLENREGKGIATDWEDALGLATGEIATLAHSDDLYSPEYARAISEAFELFPEAGLAFTLNDYIQTSPRLKTLLWIKKILNPYRFARQPVLIPGKTMLRALKLGCFIPCPTVAFHLPVLRKYLNNQKIFNPDLKIAVDWDAWIQLAKKDIPFIYIPKPLVKIRIHTNATTQEGIQSGLRNAEEFQVLESMWGKWGGKFFAPIFLLGQKLQKLHSSPKEKCPKNHL